MKLGVVSCCLQKLSYRAEARNLYRSRVFKLRRLHAEHHCDRWVILSTMHGLIEPTTVLDPYEDWIREKDRAWRNAFQDKAWRSIIAYQPKQVVLHMGREYYWPVLMRGLLAAEIDVLTPTRGMNQLDTFSWLQFHTQGLGPRF